MNFEFLQEQQSPKRKERRYFDLPSDQTLAQIVEDIYCALPADIEARAKVYVTGSAALNRFGALKRKMKDIDVVILIDLPGLEQDAIESGMRYKDWKDTVRKSLNVLPEAAEVDYKEIPDVELQQRFELQGYPVEAFIQIKGEPVIDIAVAGTVTPTLLSFALIDSIFSKKWLFNKDKAQKDLYNIRDHLASFKPTDDVVKP